MKSCCSVLIRSERSSAEVDGDRTGRDGQRRQDHLVEVGEGGLGERRVAVAGNQPRPTAKTATRMGATTKGGSASSPKVAVVETLSTGRLGLRDTTRARGMATAKAMIWLSRISSMDDRGPGGQDVGHRLVVQVRGAEVAVEGGVEPDDVLVPQRQVEAQLLEQDGPVGGGVVGPEDDLGRVAGQQVHQQEDQHGDHERHHHQLEEPSEEVLAHGSRIGLVYPAVSSTARSGSGRRCPRRTRSRPARWGGWGWRSSGPGRSATSEKMYCSSHR